MCKQEATVSVESINPFYQTAESCLFFRGIMENKQLETSTALTIEEINTLTIVDNKGNEVATELLKQNKLLQKEVKATFDSICDTAHKAWKEAVAQRDKFLKPLVDAEKSVKQKIGIFILEEQRKEREEQARLDAIRLKEEERQRKKFEAQAQKAEEKGNTEKAEELRDKKEEVFVPGAIVENTVEKIEGQSSRITYDFKVIDPNLVPRKYMVVDEKKIRQMVKTFGKDADIAGVRIFPKVVVNIRV